MAKATNHLTGKTRALATALALALVALTAFAASASALPARYWGVVPQSVLSEEQFTKLQRGGAETMRVSLDWGGMQHTRNGPIDWSGFDLIVERAAKHNIEILPFITGAPPWAVPQARVQGGGGSKAPARLPVSGFAATAWKAMLGAAVDRYGPNGEFWATHPAVPVRPIRTWQIWNEPNFKYFVAKPNPAQYGRLVKISYAALRSHDPSARVVLAGLFARPKGARNLRTGKHKSLNWYASDFVEEMYKRTPGIKTRFHGVALHPYSNRYTELPAVIEELRGVLKDARDQRKGLWVTELGWSSEPPNPSVNTFAKGPAGQARELKGAFNLLRNRQAKWKVQRVYWFSVDDAPSSCNFCDGSGLFGDGFVPKKSWPAFVRFAGGTP